MAVHTCIWCLRAKIGADFNREHVVPQSFGTFEHNLTLVNVVCQACNSLFAGELEPWLARDSLEGFDRYRYGLKAPGDFKSLGQRSTTRIQVPDGPYAGAWGYTVAGDEALGVRLFPQIGFKRTGSADVLWFTLDELPTKDELATRGLTGDCQITLCECSVQDATERLAAVGIRVAFGDTFEPLGGEILIEQVFRPDIKHRRGLAKIALNYVAHECGSEVAARPEFNAIRSFVMDGAEPAHSYYAVDDNPVIEGDKRFGYRFHGHALVASMRAEGVQVIVSLFNRLRHGFLLSQGQTLHIEERGHFFDIGNRVIHRLSR